MDNDFKSLQNLVNQFDKKQPLSESEQKALLNEYVNKNKPKEEIKAIEFDFKKSEFGLYTSFEQQQKDMEALREISNIKNRKSIKKEEKVTSSDNPLPYLLIVGLVITIGTYVAINVKSPILFLSFYIVAALIINMQRKKRW